EVDEGAAGGVLGQRGVDVAAPADLLVVGLGLGPARDEVDDVGSVAVREGGARTGDGGGRAAHVVHVQLAHRRGLGLPAAQQLVDGAGVEAAQVAGLHVVARAAAPQRVEQLLHRDVGHGRAQGGDTVFEA